MTAAESYTREQMTPPFAQAAELRDDLYGSLITSQAVLKVSYHATGAADGSLRIWDRRKIGGKDAALFTFDLHTEALMHVEWCPHRPGVVASCGEDKVHDNRLRRMQVAPNVVLEPESWCLTAPSCSNLTCSSACHRRMRAELETICLNPKVRQGRAFT